MQHSDAHRSPESSVLAFAATFLERRGVPRPREFDAVHVPADGSQRAFFRIRPRHAPISLIAVENPPFTPFFRRENIAYLEIGNHLRRRGVPVPELFDRDLDRGWFLMEDLGELRLQDALSSGSGDLAGAVLEALFHMQTQGAVGFDPAWCCQTARYDRGLMRQYESDYFREAFLEGYLGLDRVRRELEGAFEHLAAVAFSADAGFFLHRDFQSRNILVGDRGPGFVDWQGGRLGPLGYDLASFLIDPYLGLSETEQKRLYTCYADRLRDHDPSLVGRFEQTYPYLAVQRNLQVLGAYAFLSRARRKHFFLAFIPPAARTLQRLLAGLGDPRLRPLQNVVEATRGLWDKAIS
ncbi:MAG: phosphotransferase [Deltaproteobacteria bacterium]|nr:phosphotransferase [Deltaproteobacteria bacterium]